MTYPQSAGTIPGTFSVTGPCTRMALTQFAIVKAVAKDTPLKLSDGASTEIVLYSIVHV
jgi:hypothetical protein